MKTISINNPYANSDGTPKTGFLHQFFNWERNEELKRRKSLTEEEIKTLEKAENNLSKKMNS